MPAGASYEDLFRIIDSGKPYQHRLVIIEGTRTQDIVIALNKDDRLTGVILRPPVEGMLAPDTYFFERGASRVSIIERMQKRQELIIAEEWANRQEGLPYETADDAEKTAYRTSHVI